MDIKEWAVVCSPVSGKKDGKEVVQKRLLPAWQKACPNRTVKMFLTEYPRHAVELATSLAKKGCGIIAVGGDGTIHEVIEGVARAGLLKDIPLGFVSQGTMNFYAISAGLPDVEELPRLISQNTYRSSPLLKVSDNSGTLSSLSFEAFHIGPMPFNVVEGARRWRFRPGGTMAGIFLHLIVDNLFPRLFSTSGTLEMELVGGGKHTVTSKFFWIVASNRNPYTGALGRSMWVSYMTVSAFPGFQRMMAFFKPPMEHLSGLAYSFEAHFECEKFTFDCESGENRCCLDGDPVTAGSSVTVEHAPRAMAVVAPLKYPLSNPKDVVQVEYVTKAADKWLKSHPPPQGSALARPDRKPPTPRPFSLQTIALVILAYLLYRRKFFLG